MAAYQGGAGRIGNGSGFNGHVCSSPSIGTRTIDPVDDSIHGEAKETLWAAACSDEPPIAADSPTVNECRKCIY